MLGSGNVLSLHHPCKVDKIIPPLVPMDIQDFVAHAHMIPPYTDFRRDNLHLDNLKTADAHLDNFPAAKVHSTGIVFFSVINEYLSQHLTTFQIST